MTPQDAKEGPDQPASAGKVESAPVNLVENAPASPKQRRSRGIKAWFVELSHRPFLLTVISGVLSGIVVWIVQGYFTERGRKGTEASLVKTIQVSVASECRRLQSEFARFYDDYPTITCEINVYHLPQPDSALASYLNSRREAIVISMGEKGVELIRSGALATDAYSRIFTSQYFQSEISRNTTTFENYFGPLNEMCSTVNVKLSIEQCPYGR